MISDIINRFKRTFFDKKFLKYSVIGFSGVVIDFIIYAILVKFFTFPPALASVVSVSVAILNNFIWNAIFNFKKKDRILRRFIKFYLAGCIGLILTVTIIFVLHNLIGLGPMISKVISIPPVVALQFILNKKFSFGNPLKLSYKALLDTIALIGSAVCLLFLLTITTIFTVLSHSNGSAQIASGISILIFFLTITAVIFLTILLQKKHFTISSKFATIIRRSSVVYALLWGLFVIGAVSDNFSLLPGTDQAILFNGASPEWSGSSNWYLENFPYQAGVAILFKVFNIFFGTTLLPILLLNWVAIGTIFYLLNKISYQLFKSNSISSMVSILLVMVFPVTFMITMVYGDTIGIALTLGGIYFYLQYRKLLPTHHKRTLLPLTLSSLLFILMLIAKSSLLLIPVAIFTYEFMSYLTIKPKIKEGIVHLSSLLMFLVVIPYTAQTLLTHVYLNHQSIPAGRDIPKIAWVAMGFMPSGSIDFNNFQETSRKTELERPGVHNLFITWLFANKFPIDKSGDDRSSDISDFSHKHIMTSLEVFRKDLPYTLEFFSKKNAILWSDPSYGGTFRIPRQSAVFRTTTSKENNDADYYTAVSSGIKIDQSSDLLSKIIRKRIEDNYGYGIYRSILSTIQKSVYFFAFMAILSTLFLKQLRKDTTWILLLYIIICGFVFYSLWEASARYILIYYLLLLPIAAYGLIYTPRLLRQIYLLVTHHKTPDTPPRLNY